VARLAIRFPSNSADAQRQERLNLLANDLADIGADVIDGACEAAAREAQFLPSAAEIRRHAKRLADQRAGIGAGGTWAEERCRQNNIDNRAKGSDVRSLVHPETGIWEFFRVCAPGEKRRDDGRGGIIVPWFSKRDRDWVDPADHVSGDVRAGSRMAKGV